MSLPLHYLAMTHQIAGLDLTLNIQQFEYVQGLSELAGALIVVSAQELMPFPEHEAVMAAPGTLTAISMKQVRRIGEYDL